MATWRDGPEYAPVERPDAFDVPAVAPLEEPPPVWRPAAAPDERPAFDQPPVPVPALAALIPVPPDRRDPAEAFAVVSSTMTSGIAWTANRPLAEPDPQVALTPAGAPDPAYPAASPYPDAPAPAAPYAGTPPFPAPGTPPFPAPGTPQWFGPGPYGEQPAPTPGDARQIIDAATPGLLIVLLLGVILPVLPPILLGVAAVLGQRVRVAHTAVRRGFAIALGALGTFALIGVFTDPIDFGDWWGGVVAWARLINLVMLVTTVVVVRRELRRGAAPPPPPTYRGPWG